jgi:hypothetical protein
MIADAFSDGFPAQHNYDTFPIIHLGLHLPHTAVPTRWNVLELWAMEENGFAAFPCTKPFWQRSHVLYTLLAQTLSQVSECRSRLGMLSTSAQLATLINAPATENEILDRTHYEIWGYDYAVADFAKQFNDSHRDRAFQASWYS